MLGIIVSEEVGNAKTVQNIFNEFLAESISTRTIKIH